MSFRCREDHEKHIYYEKQQYLSSAIGRFRRYPSVHQALWMLQNSAVWYFSQDMKHESKEEYEKIRGELGNSYQEFLAACDTVIKK